MLNNRIENKAIEILDSLNISKPSEIDVFKIAKHLEIDVKESNMDSDMSGLFVIKDNKPYIRYNSSENKNRQRFTIAHELGHFVLHKNESLFVDKNERVLYRNSQSTTGEILKEKEANAFAAALLMPKNMIEDEINNSSNQKEIVTHLTKVFRVSEQAMSFRLSNLGYEIGFY